jgi:hypothetical protein
MSFRVMGYELLVLRGLFLVVCFLFVLSGFVYSVQSEDEVILKLGSGSQQEKEVAANEVLGNPTGYSITVVNLALDVAGETGAENLVNHVLKLLNEKYPAKKVLKSMGIEGVEPDAKEIKYDNATRMKCVVKLIDMYPRVKAKGIKNKIVEGVSEAMLDKNNDLYLRVLSAELIGNTFSPEAYEPLRKILEDPEENEVLKLAAARSLTQVTSMNPELTGGHSNYVSHEVFEGAVNYVKGALDRVSVK